MPDLLPRRIHVVRDRIRVAVGVHEHVPRGEALPDPVQPHVGQHVDGRPWSEEVDVEVDRDRHRLTTDHPEQSTAETLAKYDLLLSDWNAWGDAKVKSWPAATREAEVSSPP